MKSIEERAEVRENMLQSQVEALEEEVSYLQEQLQAEKDNFEEHYLSLREDIERMRQQFDELQHENTSMDIKCQSITKENIKLSALNKEIETMNKHKEEELTRIRQKLAESATRAEEELKVEF